MFDIFWNVSVRLVKWSHSPNHNEKLKEVLKSEKYSVQLGDVPSPWSPIQNTSCMYISIPCHRISGAFWFQILKTNYNDKIPPFGRFIELSGYIRKRDTKFWASVGLTAHTRSLVCSFHFQLWLGVSKLVAHTDHLCVASFPGMVNWWFYSCNIGVLNYCFDYLVNKL